MNGRERFNAVLRSEGVDSIPTFLFDMSLGMDVLGIPTTDVFTPDGYDGKEGASSILALHKFLGHDVAVGSYRTVDNSVFGGEIKVPEHGSPFVSKKPFADHADLYRTEPEKICDKMDDVILSYDLLRSSASDMGIMKMMMTPFSMAATMRGFEGFLMDLYVERSFVSDILDFETRLLNILVEEMDGLDTDATLLVAPYDDVDMLGHDIMEEMVIPGIKNSIDTIRNDGLPVVLHHHGSFASEHGVEALNRLLELHPDCFYYGEGNDHALIGEQTKKRCPIAGGIDTFTTIYLGPDSRVRGDVNNILEKMSNPDFIFSCSCSVDRGLSLDRLRMMMDTVRSFRPFS